MRTALMIPLGLLFISAPWRVPAEPGVGGWLGKDVVASFGLIILYVEGWFWWNRLARRRN